MLRSLLRKSGQEKLGKTYNILGYDSTQLMNHIKAHPNWENISQEKWHLDHIFPVKAFLDRGILDPAVVNRLDNLQPLSVKHNLTKHDSYEAAQFNAWLEKIGHGQ
jgi:hypothetical protein